LEGEDPGERLLRVPRCLGDTEVGVDPIAPNSLTLGDVGLATLLGTEGVVTWEGDGGSVSTVISSGFLRYFVFVSSSFLGVVFGERPPASRGRRKFLVFVWQTREHKVDIFYGRCRGGRGDCRFERGGARGIAENACGGSGTE
jgi:hypothetical protein